MMSLARLGIETVENGVSGCMGVVIERNTSIPVKKSKIFSTDADNQESVFIQVALTCALLL